MQRKLSQFGIAELYLFESKIKSIFMALSEVEMHKLGLYCTYITSYCNIVHAKALLEHNKVD